MPRNDQITRQWHLLRRLEGSTGLTLRGLDGEKESAPQVPLRVAAVKRRLKKPVKRSKREIAWALEIAGIGEGPSDLSQGSREYLSGDK
jgi:hypothetical protein